MSIDKNELESYATRILSENNVTDKEVRIVFSDNTLLFKETPSECCIEIGVNAITLMVLFSCFSINGLLFQRTLYCYYWASKSIVERKIGTCAFFLSKLREELCKNIDKMQWYGQMIRIDLLLYFVIGHETFHILFKQNEKAKQNAIIDISAFLEDMYANRLRTKSKTAERLLDNSLNSIMEDDEFKEELACDKYSLDFLFKSILNDNRIDLKSFESIYQQLLDMVMMFQYDSISSSDFRRNLKIDNLRLFILGQHYGVFRLWITAITISELDQFGIDINSCLDKTRQRYSSIHSKKMRIKLKEYAMSSNNEMGQLTDNLIKKYRQQMRLMGDLINNMLIGEAFVGIK